MATQLQLRRGTTSETGSFTGAVGEVTVDTTKDTLVVHDGSTAGGHEVAKNDGSNMTAIDVGDNVQLKMGNSDDLLIYHDGSNSFIADVGTGNLGIRAENLFLQNADGSANYATASLNGAFTLSYNNSIKLATTSSGVDVTGTATMDGLGVGTSSPGSLLELEATEATVFDETVTDGQAGNGSTLAIQNLSDTNNTFSQLLFRNRATSKAVSRIASLTDSTGTKMAFVVENNGSPAEVLRLEKTGNVSIPNGSLTFGANGEGRIRVVNTNNMVIESTTADHSGLQFGTHAISPHEAAAGSDGTIDLGTTTARFKDAYLSGGVYLGGTGTPNKLDDYEEGTWAPVLEAVSGTQPTITQSNLGYYTKVGRLVTLTGVCIVNSISGTTSGLLQISGIPFTIRSGNGYHTTGAVVPHQLTFARPDNANLSNHDTANFGFLTSNNGSGWNWESMSILQAGSQFRFSLSYYTAQ